MLIPSPVYTGEDDLRALWATVNKPWKQIRWLATKRSGKHFGVASLQVECHVILEQFRTAWSRSSFMVQNLDLALRNRDVFSFAFMKIESTGRGGTRLPLRQAS
ncbi:hypothetical protein, variant [Blastomyces gilchristii SLH14081]|uniref:Uncharacterized protein n=1 Tax=Blastomyces gilchristii (strain SLH14081) TaxID=559298 RepID=A0A179UG35_BLAGS|nr:uncharacterized protein BDBG_03072 [Blastomyces gilchristii SLH14081]XP_031577510.1 hypothetical protein, variant [Blastomyces gilchristii SLH14081]OAT06944.1 hypothetical protein BDBG_03072 [Blastomyces gilchristii SLH14081]OAT06945.1 hypothetical protein, variant [Blastomyces gilchristii SLH14081]